MGNAHAGYRNGASRLTFNDRQRDPESGDLNLGRRQDDAVWGRFNSIDPLWSRHPEESPYIYSRNNPLRYVDPTGLQCRQIPAQDPGADGAWQTGGGFDIAPEVAFDAEERALAAKQLDEEAEEMGLAVRARMVQMETQEINELTKQLETEAQQAIEKVGPGKGSTYGTKAHTAFENEVKELGLSNVRTEVSYEGQIEVSRGTKGSVRLDVVKYDANGKMSAIYDLKTGDAKMTAQRIAQIRANLPADCENVPIIVIRP